MGRFPATGRDGEEVVGESESETETNTERDGETKKRNQSKERKRDREADTRGAESAREHKSGKATDFRQQDRDKARQARASGQQRAGPRSPPVWGG